MSANEPPDTALVIALFGPMEVRVHGRPLPPLRSRKALWMLALLALRSGREVEREWLAGILWPDTEQSLGFNNLRVVLSEVRKALGEEGGRVHSPGRHTLVLDASGANIDVRDFDAAIADGSLPALKRAAALYSAPLLEGCPEEWVLQERKAREDAGVQALLSLGEAALSAEDYSTAAGYYRRVTEIDPFLETGRRKWMEALANSGDTNAALQAYREFVTFLKDDPKAAPDIQTSALYQRLRAEVRRKAGAHALVKVG